MFLDTKDPICSSINSKLTKCFKMFSWTNVSDTCTYILDEHMNNLYWIEQTPFSFKVVWVSTVSVAQNEQSSSIIQSSKRISNQ